MSHNIESFDPNGVGVNNGNFIGLPFTEDNANIVLQPIPWEVTTSYRPGTAAGPENIRATSTQLDLIDVDVPNAWKMGIFMRSTNEDVLETSDKLRAEVESYINFLESTETEINLDIPAFLKKINQASETLNNWVYEQTKTLLNKGKLVGLVGGDHSTPLGFMEALGEKHGEFGVLQIDAHCDLRKAYEGFEYSHASIFYNALKMPEITKLVQVGIRDFCEEELDLIKQSQGRIQTFYDHQIKGRIFEGTNFQEICQGIVKHLPEKVYISFDI
jgi:agmatinase